MSEDSTSNEPAPQASLAEHLLTFLDDVRRFERHFGMRGSPESISACDKLIAEAVSLIF